MIIKIIDNSPKNGKNGTATGAVNYVLSMKDWKGNDRDNKPEILDGDADYTKLVDSIVKNQHKCISGVIGFAPDEHLTREQKLELIEEFKNTFLGNMKDRVNCLFVEHKEDDGDHIHFIINRIDLKTGKAYNPFSPGDTTMELRDCFMKIQRQKYGFNQVVADPMKLILKNGEKKAKLYSDYKTKFSNLFDKENIHKACIDLVKKGVVNNKEELVSFLQNEMGYKLYSNQNNIVILKNKEKIVLKGSIYQNNSLSYTKIKDDFDKWKQNKANSDVDINKQLEKLNRLVKSRDGYNEKRYTATPSKEVKFKNLPTRTRNELQAVRPGSPTLPPTQQAKTVSSPVLEGSSEPMAVKNSNGQGSSSENSPRGANTTAFRSIGSSSIGGGGGSLNVSTSAIETAKAKLASAITWAERIQAQQELSKAMADYEFNLATARSENEKQALAELEQKRIAELNKENKL